MARENRYVSSMYSLGGSAKCVGEKNEKTPVLQISCSKNSFPRCVTNGKEKREGRFGRGEGMDEKAKKQQMMMMMERPKLGSAPVSSSREQHLAPP